ncbi:MAG TPA: hypothetical protein VI756_10360, partial [Blastocatellia bacterium]
MFSGGQADAIFRVRALGNPSIHRLVQSGKVRFLPIKHAAAIKIKQPAFEPALIPAGLAREPRKKCPSDFRIPLAKSGGQFQSGPGSPGNEKMTMVEPKSGS